MKKIRMMLLSVVLCLQLTACTLPAEMLSGLSDRESQDETRESRQELQAETHTSNSAADAIQNFRDRASMEVANADPEDDMLDAVRNFLDQAQQQGSTYSGEDIGRVELAGPLSESVAGYIDSFLRAAFYGDYEQYSEYATESAGQILHMLEVVYFVDNLIIYADVVEDYIDTDTMMGYADAAEYVLSSMKWEITEMEVEDEESQSGWVEMELYPTDFFALINDDLVQASDDFNAQTRMLQRSGLFTEEKLAQMESDYAVRIREIADEYAPQAKALGIPVSSVFEFNLSSSEYVLVESDWEYFLEIMLNLQ